jgi:hypothetical protein
MYPIESFRSLHASPYSIHTTPSFYQKQENRKDQKKEKENIPPSSLDAGVVPSSPYENLNSLPALALAYCE